MNERRKAASTAELNVRNLGGSAAAETILELQQRVRELENQITELEDDKQELTNSLRKLLQVIEDDLRREEEIIPITTPTSDTAREQTSNSLPWIAGKTNASSSHSMVSHLQSISRLIREHVPATTQRTKPKASELCSRLGIHGIEEAEETFSSFSDEELQIALEQTEAEYKLLQIRYSRRQNTSLTSEERNELESQLRQLQLLRRICRYRKLKTQYLHEHTPSELLRESRAVQHPFNATK